MRPYYVQVKTALGRRLTVHAALLAGAPHGLAVAELDLKELLARRDLHRGHLAGVTVHHITGGRIAVFAVETEGDIPVSCMAMEELE